MEAWEAQPELSGPGLAAALEAAVGAVARLRSSQSIDLVWTGPATAEVPVRLTAEVLAEVIGSATGRLIVVSFAAYRVPELVAALVAAARRGVEVRLVLEDGDADGGTLKVPAAAAFGELEGPVTSSPGPASERPVLPGGSRASMHAKAAIADEHTSLTTSANLTGHGIEANTELGLLIRGGPIPKRLARHFRQLMALGILRPVGE